MIVCLLTDCKMILISETLNSEKNEHLRINELWYIRCYIYIIPNPHQALWDRNFYLPLADEETDNISSWSKVK